MLLHLLGNQIFPEPNVGITVSESCVYNVNGFTFA